MIKEISEFCDSNKIPCYASTANGDKIKFYLQTLYLNDITRPFNKRLTPSELNILAHIVDYIIKNGQIKNDKEKFDNIVNYLVKNNVVKNKATFSTNKTNILQKGYLVDGYGRSSIAMDEKFLNVIKTGKINIYICLK